MRDGALSLRTLGWTMVVVGLSAPGCGGDDPTQPVNRPPQLLQLRAFPPNAVLQGTIDVSVFAADPDRDPLVLTWSATGGIFQDRNQASTQWTAPDAAGPVTVVITADDGQATARDSMTIQVGNAILRVDSDPPGAGIVLNGVPTSAFTPHSFDPIAAGKTTVTLGGNRYVYGTSLIDVDLDHEQSEAILFEARVASTIPVSIGRDDLLEIGALALLPSGAGFLYSARSDTGTGLYSAGTNVASGSANGVLLASGVAIHEPIGVTADGDSVFFVTGGGDLTWAELVNPDGNGVIDGLGGRDSAPSRYGPAVSRDSWVAHSSVPSDSPPVFLRWDRLQVPPGLPGGNAASEIPGRRASWRPVPRSDRIVFERDGDLWLNTGVADGTPTSAPWIEESYTTAPDWGARGVQHIAYLTGAEGELDAVALAVPDDSVSVTVYTGLTDARAVRWNPVQKTLLVAHNPGRPEVLFVVNLPVP